MSTSDPTARLSGKYSFGCDGRPLWGVETVTGKTRRKQQRNRANEQPAWEWNIAFNVKTPAEAAALSKFRDAHEGGLRAFRFTWHDFYQAEDELFGEDSGSEHQLIVNRDESPVAFPLSIFRPVEGTLTVKKGTSLGSSMAMTEGVGYDVDYRTGLVTLASALTAGQKVWWSGEFDWLVRFVGDPAIVCDTSLQRAFQDILLETVE